MARLFFALWPDAAARDALAKAAACVDVREGHRVRPANLHLTLAFLGSVPAAAQAALMAAEPAPGAAAFTLEVGLAGWWRTSRVAWLAPLEEPLAKLEVLADVLFIASLGLESGAAAALDPRGVVEVGRHPRRVDRIVARHEGTDFGVGLEQRNRALRV